MSCTCKEYIAGFLLLIFLALQTGVIVHDYAHDGIHLCDHTENSTIAESGHHCAICDYTVTKFELSPITIAGNFHVAAANELFITPAEPDYPQHYGFIFLRGPPSMT